MLLCKEEGKDHESIQPSTIGYKCDALNYQQVIFYLLYQKAELLLLKPFVLFEKAPTYVCNICFAAARVHTYFFKIF